MGRPGHQRRPIPGDIRLRLRLRLRHGEQTGDWFDWVWLDPDTLEKTAGQAGLRVAEVRRFGPAWYAATLHRTTP